MKWSMFASKIVLAEGGGGGGGRWAYCYWQFHGKLYVEKSPHSYTG